MIRDPFARASGARRDRGASRTSVSGARASCSRAGARAATEARGSDACAREWRRGSALSTRTAVFAVIWRNLSDEDDARRATTRRRARTRADATRDANLHAMILLHDRSIDARSSDATTDRRRRTTRRRAGGARGHDDGDRQRLVPRPLPLHEPGVHVPVIRNLPRGLAPAARASRRAAAGDSTTSARSVRVRVPLSSRGHSHCTVPRSILSK